MSIWVNNKVNLTDQEIQELNKANSHEKELILLFKFIKSRGWINYKRIQGKSDGLLGNIFEDLIGLKENNNRTSDYFDIEIKTKNYESSSSLVSLFCYSIDSIKNSSSKIREEFGVEDENSYKKIFNSTVKYGEWNTHRGGYNFKLEEKDEKKLYLKIMNVIENYLVDQDKYYWNYEKIQKSVGKIKNCLYIEGEINTQAKQVKYTKATLYKNASYKKFWDLLKEKHITVDFRIGVYKSGKNKGKTHDHGTSFRIKKDKLSDLYESKIEIN